MYEMQFMGPNVLLPTEVGNVDVTFTDGTHVYATANTGSHYDRGDVAYRGKRYHVRLYLTLLESGRYAENDKQASEFTQVETYPSKAMPPTYRANVVEVIISATRAFITENPDVLVAAERNKLANDLKRAQRDERTAYDAYLTANHKLTELHDNLRALDASASRVVGNAVHKARPSEHYAGHCAVCRQRIRRVPGGDGPTWVHSDSGAVAGSGPDPARNNVTT